MRSVLALLLCMLAPAASAGDIQLPLQVPDVCADIDVTDVIVAPGAYAVADPRTCATLCKRAGASCKRAVKDVASCEARVFRDSLSFMKTHCKVDFAEDPLEVRACLEEMRAYIHAVLSGRKEVRDEEIDACAEWTATCSASCAAP